MKIFYYTWHENSEGDLKEALSRLGHSIVKCHIPLKDYEDDEEFTENLEQLFNKYSCDIFFSFDFFPIIAKSADKLKKRYIAWIYDMPPLTLYSPMVKSEYVSLFMFDRTQYEQIRQIKPSNVFHLPLPVNTIRLNKQLGNLTNEVSYENDVSFVGSLYENNMYRQIKYLPDYLKGYIDGIIQAQQKVYGYNMIEDVLKDEIVMLLEKYVKMNLNPSYYINSKKLYADMINAEITCRERIGMLTKLADKYNVSLYTGSNPKLVPSAIDKGIVSYDIQMPQVFRSSKININVTLRSIISGIPLRAIDIMGAGGFLLSNYQPELAEYFVDGEEMVMFESEEDMLAKVDYYLRNDNERRNIAYKGWKKVQEQFSYDQLLKQIFVKV